MNIGFIGLGAMGRHMAANLASGGHALQTFDVNGKGNRKSAREAAKDIEVLFTSLPGPAEVKAVSMEIVESLSSGSAINPFMSGPSAPVR